MDKSCLLRGGRGRSGRRTRIVIGDKILCDVCRRIQNENSVQVLISKSRYIEDDSIALCVGVILNSFQYVVRDRAEDLGAATVICSFEILLFVLAITLQFLAFLLLCRKGFLIDGNSRISLHFF